MAESEERGGDVGAIGVFEPELFLVADGSKILSLVFEDGAEFCVVEEAAFDGGLEDEPGALELSQVKQLTRIRQIQVEAFLNKLIAEETGVKEEQVEKDTDRDYWMNADEAKGYGLINKIVTSRKDLA